MRVAITEHDFSLHYELTLDEDDHRQRATGLPGGPVNELELVGRRFTVALPGEFRALHPDTHAAAIWWYLRPFIGSELHLPFEVSELFAGVMKSLFGLTLSRVSATVRPREVPAQPRPGLLFSGGMDSVAASLVAPPDTVGLFLDRIPRLMNRPECQNALIDLVNQRAVSELRRTHGMQMAHVADDHEALFRPYPTWHSNMDAVAALYLADSLSLGHVFTGDVLDVFHFRGYVSEDVTSWTFQPGGAPSSPELAPPETPRSRLAGADLESFNPLALAGLSRVDLVGGLTEIGTTAVVARTPFLGRTFSCYQKTDRFFCMACDKCFKKLLLLKILAGEQVSPAIIDHFLSYPYLSRIFSRRFVEWHHIWCYIFQRIRCSHWFVRELQRQARQGPDLSVLEKWYPPSRALIPAAYRDHVEEAITGHVPAMTAAEVATLEGLSIPPLDPPDLSKRGGPPRGRLLAFSDPLLDARVSGGRAPEGEAGQAAPREAAADVISESHWAINTTVRCQHRCVYCFEGSRGGKGELSAEEIRSLIDRAAEEVPMLIFMGAEPTLGANIIEMTRYACGRGLKVVYSTNALRFADAEFLERCVEAGLTGIELSFHYPDAEVYSQITRAKPALFQRLLRALDNINAHNRRAGEGARFLSVNVNLVVSRLNVLRLPEVLGHLRTRLAEARPCVTLRRVMLDTSPGADRGLRDTVYVPLPRLREALADALERWPAGLEELLVRGFPLCAVPGREHRDGDLLYLLDNVRIRHNFDDQRNDASMLAQHHMRTEHPFAWICEGCALEPVCLQRGLFQSTPRRPEDAPIAHTGALPPELAQTLTRGSPEQPAPFLVDAGHPLGSSAAGRLLRALAEARPPRAPADPDGWAWAPVCELELQVWSGGASERVAISIVPAAPAAWPEEAGRVALISLDPVGDERPPPLQRALEELTELLERILDEDEALAGDEAWHAGGAQEPRLAPEDDPVSQRLREFLQQSMAGDCALQDHRLDDIVSVTADLPERLKFLDAPRRGWRDAAAGAVGDALREDPDLVRVRVGGYRDLLCLRWSEEPELHALLTARLSERSSEGFLCGLLRVLPSALLMARGRGRRAVQTAARALLQLQRTGPWPGDPPGATARPALEIWRRFGVSLLPHRRGGLLLRGGEVSCSTVRLNFFKGAAHAVSLWFFTAPDGARAYRHDGLVGLRYNIAAAHQESPEVQRVIDWYGEKLMGR